MKLVIIYRRAEYDLYRMIILGPDSKYLLDHYYFLSRVDGLIPICYSCYYVERLRLMFYLISLTRLNVTYYRFPRPVIVNFLSS